MYNGLMIAFADEFGIYFSKHEGDLEQLQFLTCRELKEPHKLTTLPAHGALCNALSAERRR